MRVFGFMPICAEICVLVCLVIFPQCSSWVCTPHMENAGLFEHAEVRQLAYFQLNIEMCLPSYFPLSNVWIINVPENREQSKQLWGLESLFNLLFQTQRQLNAVWTETGKKQLTLQRPEATPVEASHLKQKEWNWTCPPGRHGFFTANWSWS